MVACSSDGSPLGAREVRLENASFKDFSEKLCEVHSDWGLNRPKGHSFDAQFRHERMGDVGFTDVKVGFELSGERTKGHIRRLNDTFYGVVLMLEGGQSLVQGNQEVNLQPGDISVWDASRPAQFNSAGPVRQVSVLIPHNKIKLYSSNIEDVCAQRINGRSGLGLLLASHLYALSEVLPRADEAARAGAAAATLDLVSAAIRPEHASEYKSSIHKVMHRRIQDFIVNNLREPDLSPGAIAESFHISQRYLHKLFEPTDYTVSEWILQRRLIACQTAFMDPALNHMTITEIAFNWGFSSASYFSRVYRQQFGVTPTETREIQREVSAQTTLRRRPGAFSLGK